MGFNAGDGQTSFTLPEALTEQTRNIDHISNVGEPGILIYRIDGKLRTYTMIVIVKSIILLLSYSEKLW